jgi:hypothetical protein
MRWYRYQWFLKLLSILSYLPLLAQFSTTYCVPSLKLYSKTEGASCAASNKINIFLGRTSSLKTYHRLVKLSKLSLWLGQQIYLNKIIVSIFKNGLVTFWHILFILKLYKCIVFFNICFLPIKIRWMLTYNLLIQGQNMKKRPVFCLFTLYIYIINHALLQKLLRLFFVFNLSLDFSRFILKAILS